MIQKLWLKKLKLSYSENVLDIIQFGSSVLEESEPNDIDIAVIFNKVPLKQQLEERQNIKNQIQKEVNLPVHIESFDFYSFFNKGNFARFGILFYGKSIINGKNFSEHFGLIPKLRISYVLKDLEKKDKVKFNYLLSGKKGSYGLLKKYGGKILSPGVAETLPENEEIFLKGMKKITNKLSVEKVFVQK
jgi:predicted nucleotidyltransferase